MRSAALFLALGLMACAGPETAPTVEESPLDVAAQQFPGVDVQAMANCVRENATEAELVLLAEGGELAQTTTRQILAKPETADCLIAADVQLPRASG